MPSIGLPTRTRRRLRRVEGRRACKLRFAGRVSSITLTPNAGYAASVGGTCGGTLSGNTYTTNSITTNCTVVAAFKAAPPPQATTYNVDISYVPAGQGGAGQPQTITYPSGKTLTYQYDATGQITGLAWNGQPLITNLTWTPLGAPKGWNWSFISGNPTSTRTYDTAGQLTSNGIASYQYDVVGRVSQIAQNLFGPASTAGGAATPITIATSIAYDPAGRVNSVTHAPVSANLPAGIKLQDIIGPLAALYSYDANGNRGQALYSQFEGSDDINGLTRDFSLNPANNRVEGVRDIITQTSGSPTNETRTLQWNAAGYLQSDGVLYFEYDPRGQVNKIINTETSTTTTYLNNALGQRVRKVVDGNQITDTVYGEELGMASYPLGNYQPGHAENTTEYIYLPTAQGPMPVAVQIGNALYAIDADHLNTPRRLTDQNGNPVWQWVTTGFGELEPTTAETGFVRARLAMGTPAIANTAAVEFNLRYPGQQYDAETGLYYNHHRYYDPYLTVGYTQVDPLGLDGGWNRYGYVEGDTVNGMDPEGLQFLTLTTFESAKRNTTLDEAVRAGAWTRAVTMPAIIAGSSAPLIATVGATCSAASSWYMMGAEADAAWLNLTLREKLLYEIGQKTTASYARYASLSPVARGTALVAANGWGRALAPELGGLGLGLGRTFSTGPTPLFRWLLPKIIGGTVISGALTSDSGQCSCRR